MIPFISAINVISTGKCCAGINKFLEYSSTEGQSDTSTALNYSARSEHVQPGVYINAKFALNLLQ